MTKIIKPNHWRKLKGDMFMNELMSYCEECGAFGGQWTFWVHELNRDKFIKHADKYLDRYVDDWYISYNPIYRGKGTFPYYQVGLYVKDWLNKDLVYFVLKLVKEVMKQGNIKYPGEATFRPYIYDRLGRSYITNRNLNWNLYKESLSV